MTKKFLILTKCEDCKFYIFDDNSIEDRWGKSWCETLDIEVNHKTIPGTCLLPDYDDDRDEFSLPF